MNEAEKNSIVVISGATHPPVTTRIEDLMKLSPSKRVILFEDCPEIKMGGQADD
jgi:hypothetical protein